MKHLQLAIVRTAEEILAAYMQADKAGTDTSVETLEKLIALFREQQDLSPAASAFTLNQYQELAQRTLPERGRNHFFDIGSEDFDRNIDLIHASLKLPSEVGEMLDPIARAMFYGKALGPEQIANIKEEAGDLLWYIASPLCRALNCTVEELARGNIAKLQKRYPDTYSDQAALARADKAEGET